MTEVNKGLCLVLNRGFGWGRMRKVLIVTVHMLPWQPKRHARPASSLPPYVASLRRAIGGAIGGATQIGKLQTELRTLLRDKAYSPASAGKSKPKAGEEALARGGAARKQRRASLTRA